MFQRLVPSCLRSVTIKRQVVFLSLRWYITNIVEIRGLQVSCLWLRVPQPEDPVLRLNTKRLPLLHGPVCVDEEALSVECAWAGGGVTLLQQAMDLHIPKVKDKYCMLHQRTTYPFPFSF